MNISTPWQGKKTVLHVRAGAKGYHRRSDRTVVDTLGIRENTRMTVTHREELFTLP